MTKNQRAWIAALLTGGYKMAQRKLRRSNGEPAYCCLGVLCEISGLGKWDFDGYRVAMHTPSRINLINLLMVREWIGLDNTKGEKILGRAVRMNDGGKHDFVSIASMLRKELGE